MQLANQMRKTDLDCKYDGPRQIARYAAPIRRRVAKQ